MTPELSIIVPTRDRPELLSRCLDALLTQVTRREYEVVVANDGGHLKQMRQLEDPRVVVLTTGGSGPARARNQGVQVARGELLLFTDDDTVPEQGWLEAAASTLDEAPGAVGVEGPVDGGSFDPLFEHSIDNQLSGAYYTCNVGYRRQVFVDSGGFDVAFPAPHCEDIDLGRRIAKRGEILFAPAMRVLHPPRPIGFWEQAGRGRLVGSEWRLHTKHPETRPSRWPVRWAPLVRMSRRWQRRFGDEVMTHKSLRRAAHTSVLAMAQLTVALHTTVTQWDAQRPHSKRRSAFRSAMNVTEEVISFARISAGRQSSRSFALDAVLYRVQRIRPRGGLGSERTIEMKEGPVLTYRRNRGDIQTIREVWIDNVYRLPIEFAPRSVLDLGANIGLASVWFSNAYSSYVTAVEPLPSNADLARKNFMQNRVAGEIIQAAVGPEDGVGWIEIGLQPNLGRLATYGMEVSVVGISSLLRRLGQVDLVKLDIEGGEAALLEEPGWLDACRALIVEFHPAVVDRDKLAAVIVERGFAFYPAGSVLPKTADFFVRR